MRINGLMKFTYWSLLIFIFFIPISSFISVRLLVLTSILSLINKRDSNLLFASWDITIYLLVLIVGLVYTLNLEIGFKVLETSFSFIAIPFVISNLDYIQKQRISQIFYSFIMGLVVGCLTCLITALTKFLSTEDIQVFFFYKLTDVINFHPTYFAYYLIFSITYIIYILYYGIEETHKLIWLSILVFFFIMLILTGGKTTFISLLMIFSFFILKYLLEESTRDKKVVFFVIVCLLIGLFATNYINSFDAQFSSQNDYWERSQLWESALVANPNPIIGVGTGDYKTILNEYYISHGMIEFAKDSFNSHNQFIQIYFSNGIIGLFAVLVLIGRPLYLSVRSQNTLGILLIFPFIIYGVTEVFLGRYQGVVFFALLHQIVIYQHYSTRFPITLKEG